MKKILLQTEVTTMLADTFTPVGIYLRLRDRFRDTILLESTDSHAAENSYSFIGVNAIGGIEISSLNEIEYKYPKQEPQKEVIKNVQDAPDRIWSYMQQFEMQPSAQKEAAFAQGLYGYTTYDAIPFFDTIAFKAGTPDIPLMRYRLYQYVIAFNHFKDELYICENKIEGIDSELDALVSCIKNKDVPQYPFSIVGAETSNYTDEAYRVAVQKGIQKFDSGEIDRIVITRPAVSVDEQHGFLPGDINKKMEPWTRPIFDFLEEHYTPKHVLLMLENKEIEISPLAYMRGRTFKRCWIVADEMQNATAEQMKMLLTRIGEGSKIVVTGDLNQHDRGYQNNGLKDFTEKLSPNQKYIGTVHFKKQDIERHPAVAEILTIYKDEI
jgi:hypothetical protein